MHSSERTGTDFSAVKHQSHQPSSSIWCFLIRSMRWILQISSTDLSSIFYIEGTFVTLSPTLMDPAVVSVVRAVDGQETGLSVQPAEKKNRLQTGISSTECTGPGFSAFKASADRPAKRTRPLTSYPVSQSRVFTKLVTCFHRPVTKFIT